VVIGSRTDPAVQRRADGGVRLDLAGPVATVSLIRPHRRNAQTPRTWAALREIGEALPAEVRVVVVRGEGSSFSAGLDLRLAQPEGVPGEVSFADIGGFDDAQLAAHLENGQRAFSWLRRPHLTSIAVVQGHAVGAGFQLALACDLRVVAADVQLCMLEARLGMVPDLGGSQPLVELVGISRALELCLTARRVGAAEAYRLGLATSVAPAGELAGTVDALVAAVLATPHESATATKALLRAAAARSLDEQLHAERQAQLSRLRVLFGSHHEGEPQ
jgi:enoyl-CoA hydratase/carnithine racemase